MKEVIAGLGLVGIATAAATVLLSQGKLTDGMGSILCLVGLCGLLLLTVAVSRPR